MKNSPLVSVLLPVRNGMPYLVEAIESILKQTFSDFEFVIVNDGSGDGTLSYLKSLQDCRLRILTTEGIGLVNALNLGLQECSGKYLVRMDADDVSEPDRIATQLHIIEANDDVGVVCSNILRIDEDGKIIGSERSQIDSMNTLRDGLLGKLSMKPVVHPTVMVRTQLLIEIGGYRHYQAAEDRDLWLRLMDRCIFTRIQKPLVKYRVTSAGVSRMQRERQAASAMMAILNYEVHSMTGIDLYITYPSVLGDIRPICSDFVIRQAKCFSKFEDFKFAVRDKNIFGILRFVFGIFAGGSLNSMPFLRRRSERRFLDGLVLLCTELLVSANELPMKTFENINSLFEQNNSMGEN